MALANMTQEQTNKENRNHCKRIAETLEEYVNGDIYKCPECGEHCNIEETENENGEIIYKCSCGCETEYEPEQMTLYDYLDDIFDIEYRISGRGEYRSVQIMVACGGPNIYINTASKQVELYWWRDRADYPISFDTVDALDEWAEELYNCTR